jgi:hypothetical protein
MNQFVAKVSNKMSRATFMILKILKKIFEMLTTCFIVEFESL